MVCTTNNMASAARRTLSTAHVLAVADHSANRALTSGCNPVSEATTPTASSRRSNEAGKLRSRPGTPLATIEAPRMASPAHTHSATGGRGGVRFRLGLVYRAQNDPSRTGSDSFHNPTETRADQAVT